MEKHFKTMIDLETELDLWAGRYEQTTETVVEERGHIHLQEEILNTVSVKLNS